MSDDSAPVLNASEAAIVASQFRNTLRVTADDSDKTPELDDVEDGGEDIVESFEKDHNSFLKAIPEEVRHELEVVESETGCSPVLSQLGYFQDASDQ